MIDSSGEITCFFNFSTIRSAHLEKLLSDASASHQKLQDPCRTRWVARIESLDDIRQSYTIILTALEDMAYTSAFNTDTKKDALCLLNSFSSFSYIVSLVIVSNIMNYTMPLTRILQERQMDIGKAIFSIQLTKTTIQKLRDNVERYHKEWYVDSLKIAKDALVPESMPRTARRQCHRENHYVGIPENYTLRIMP